MLSTVKFFTLATSSSTSTPLLTSSADEIANNDDLLMEILRCLPIKSLLKFESVSQHWLSLISSPHFSLLRNPNPVSGLFLRTPSAKDHLEYKFIPLHDGPSIPSPSLLNSLSFIHHPSQLEILHSCNGFLLCSRKLGEISNPEYFIYNPTSRQFTLLPELLDRAYYPVVSMSLAFDPSKSLDYEVVCIRNKSAMLEEYLIEVYSSEYGSWRQSGDPFTAGHKFNHGIFWNGAIHWISVNIRGIIELETILCFDVNEEQFREIPMPEIPDDWNWNDVRIRFFGESRNHLHIILLERPCSARFNVYEMKKDYSRWFVKHQVDLGAVISTEFPEMRRSILHHTNLLYNTFSILSLVRKENDEESFLVLRIPGKAISYNFKDETCTKLCDLAHAFLDWRCTYQYVETLASVQ